MQVFRVQSTDFLKPSYMGPSLLGQLNLGSFFCCGIKNTQILSGSQHKTCIRCGRPSTTCSSHWSQHTAYRLLNRPICPKKAMSTTADCRVLHGCCEFVHRDRRSQRWPIIHHSKYRSSLTFLAPAPTVKPNREHFVFDDTDVRLIRQHSSAPSV